MTRQPFDIEFEIAKEDIKFSAAHFTIFADGSRERLHGHNYRVRLHASYQVVSSDMAVNYGDLKKCLRAVVGRYDEYLLIPAHSKHLKLVQHDSEVEMITSTGRFIVPRGDVIILPVENITGEALAMHIREEFMQGLRAAGVPLPAKCSIGIGSGDGQWVTVHG